MGVVSEKEKSSIKRNQIFLVSMIEQSMILFTKTEMMEEWGVHFDRLNFSHL